LTRAATILGAAIAMSCTIASAEAMSAYRWKHRPVVVIAGPGGETALAEQRRIFSANRVATNRPQLSSFMRRPSGHTRTWSCTQRLLPLCSWRRFAVLSKSPRSRGISPPTAGASPS
jgi:hypothetical protein